MNPKHKLRHEYLTRRKEYPKDLHTIYSMQISKKILDYCKSNGLKTLMSFISIRDEVNLLEFMIQAQHQSIKVLVPKVINDHEMVAVEFKSLGELERGLKNTVQPKNAKEYQGNIDAILVPGVVFDKKGYRLGYGAGFYDRFLNSHSPSIRIAPAFQLQVVDEIPVDLHDEKMDILFTENEEFTFKRSR